MNKDKFKIETIIDGRAVNEIDIIRKELERSREALALLKKHLGNEGMRSLLEKEIAKTDARFMEWAEISGDGFRVSKTIVNVKGMKAEEFLGWFGKINKTKDIDALLVANPEHYLVLPSFNDGEKQQELIETMGMDGGPGHFILSFPSESEYIPEAADPSYEYAMIAVGKLASNGVNVKINGRHQFKNTEEGFQANLNIYFPDSASDEMVEGHKWHLAVEFNNWISAAYRDLQSNSKITI